LGRQAKIIIPQRQVGYLVINNMPRWLFGNFRFEYVHEFSIPVHRVYIITSHTNLVPKAFFATGKQHEVVRSLEMSQV